MPQGPGPLRQILLPPEQGGPRMPLDPTPLAKTNPGLARLIDFFGGLTGMQDALTPESSGATVAGAGLGAALPLGMAMGSLKKIAQPIKAYHGSPHDFDKFSLSKIGTGEGAQAYGHGLYFAENPGVAADYRNRLTPQSKGVATTNAETTEPWYRLFHEKYGGQLKDEKGIVYPTVTDVLERMQSGKDSFVPADLREALQPRLNKGRMYEVGLHASPDDFLDWDKPLSQQSEKVRQALQGLRVGSSKTDGFQELARSPEGAAALKSSGIKGIRYLDQGSRRTATPKWHVKTNYYEGEFPTQAEAQAKAEWARGRGHTGIAVTHQPAEPGTSNFVVFDDDIIEIQKKLALLLAAGAGTAQSTKSERK